MTAALHLNFATVGVDNLPRDRKAESYTPAGVRGITTVETVENVGQVFAADARPIVPDDHFDPPASQVTTARR